MSLCPLCKSEGAGEDGVWGYCSNDECPMSEEWLPLAAWEALSAIGEDVARYRWLLENQLIPDGGGWFLFLHVFEETEDKIGATNRQIDSAIDAQMKEGNNGNPES